MRVELERAVPGIEALAGTAEAIPRGDGSADVVTCAQAFHWFDTDAALREMHRVLRSGGGVGLVWNTRDESDPLQAEIGAIIGEESSEGLRDELYATVARSGLFSDVEGMTCGHAQLLSLDQLVDRVATVSFVAALPGEKRRRLLDRVRAAAARVPEPIRAPFITEAFAFDRLD